MALPSGYIKLDYIQSSGTQYINTGFTPKGNSRVVMDFENMLIPADAAALFGARTDTEKNVFGMWFDTTAVQPHYGNVTYNTNPIAVASYNVRQIYDLNKGVATVGGTSVTFNQLTFNSGCNLTLLAINTNGTVDERRASGKLYSAKIYDNGTLVRDFIPCKNASGTIGLWDNVNSVFYANAGTGTFSTGTKHKTLIDGTGYEIKSGRVLIAVTGYGVKKGRTLIGGTGYDIKFGVPVGELTVGTSVYMNVNGVRTEFIVVHQGNPDSKWYTAGGNGTWVLIKQVSKRLTADLPSDGWTIGDYQGSFLDTYANGEFLTSLDANIQSIIQQVTFKYICYSSSGNALKKETTRKIMFPDLSDLGISVTESLRKHSVLAYFKNSDNSKRIATNGSSNCPYFTCDFIRSGQNTYYWYYITASGNIDRTQSEKIYVRPLYVLPQDTLVDDNFNIMPE